MTGSAEMVNEKTRWKMGKLWIMYDDTPAHLPLCVTDSATKLAKVANRSEGTVRSMASRLRSGVYQDSRFAWVYADEDEHHES